MPEVTRPSTVLQRLLRPGRRPDDRGAVATVFAVLLAGGVLLGMIAVVIDVGQIYAEREDLQSGADAAVIAVAKACANNDPRCNSGPDVLALAAEYADKNARDGTSAVAEICGRLPGRLTACSTPPTNLSACLGSPPPSPTSYVEVRLQTRMPDGQMALPPVFAQALPGNEGMTGVEVSSCARARWEPVHVLAMTISRCEFENATNFGLDFGLSPPYPPDPSVSDESTIFFPAGHVGGTCPPDPPGSYWVEPDEPSFLDGGATCEFTMPVDGRWWGDDMVEPANQPPATCEQRLRDAASAREVVYVPIHDGHHHEPGRTEYHHIYVVPFVVTGHFFAAGGSNPSWLTSQLPCSDPDERCVSGVFVGPAVSLYSLTGDNIVTLIG